MQSAFEALKIELTQKGVVRLFREVVVQLEIAGIEDYSIEILRSLFQMVNHVEGNILFQQEGYVLVEGREMIGME